MKLLMLYHPNSDHERTVLTFQEDFRRLTGTTAELVSLETREGSHYAQVYDVMQYPAVLVLKNDGEYLKHWEGEYLPTMQEVSSYMID